MPLMLEYSDNKKKRLQVLRRNAAIAIQRWSPKLCQRRLKPDPHFEVSPK